jgi:hypothetical protein
MSYSAKVTSAPSRSLLDDAELVENPKVVGPRDANVDLPYAFQ